MIDSRRRIFTNKHLAVLGLDEGEWHQLKDTRRHGERFSLVFPHAVAGQGKANWFVLVAVADKALLLGVLTSKSAVSTFSTRLVFDFVTSIKPESIIVLLSNIQNKALKPHSDRLADFGKGFTSVSQKLGQSILELIYDNPANGPAIARAMAYELRPTINQDARALQVQALDLAIKAFGGAVEASELNLTGDESALGTVRLLEDAVIEHDARWIPEWTLSDSDLSGKAIFRKRDETLTVFTANKRPLEELFGVDLIYLNERRGALVMVQYKMLEPAEQKPRLELSDFLEDGDREQGWICRINKQFQDEMERMERFDKDHEPEGSYRLHPGAFYCKFVRRNAGVKTTGFLLSLGHIRKLLKSGQATGPRDGLRLSYEELDGHYLRSDAFAELVRSGYIGTRGVTTSHLQTLIDYALKGGKAVVVGLERKLESERMV